MSIKITIEGDTPLQALSQLTAIGMHCQGDAAVYATAKRILETEGLPSHKPAGQPEPPAPAPAPAPVTPPVSVTPPTPGAPAPAVPVTQAPAPVAAVPVAQSAPVTAVPVAQTPAPAYTKEQVASAGAMLIQSRPEKRDELIGLLAQFGVNAINNLPDAQLGAFATALRGLGANI